VLRARRQLSGKPGKPVQGDPWRRTALHGMLRSPALLGQAVHGGKPVTGDDGMPVTRGPALITQEEFDRLQFALTSATRAQTRAQTPSLLLGIAFCGSCGGPDSEWVPEPAAASVIACRRAAPTRAADLAGRSTGRDR
jgi:Recombinase